VSRKYLVTVSVSIRPIGGPVEYAALGYHDEVAVERPDLQPEAQRLTRELVGRFEDAYKNTILADDR